MSIRAEQPLYLIGGFGGCARDIAETLGLTTPWAPLNRAWQGRQAFEAFATNHLNNGLTSEENRILAETPHVDQAIVLVLKGLTRVK